MTDEEIIQTGTRAACEAEWKTIGVSAKCFYPDCECPQDNRDERATAVKAAFAAMRPLIEQRQREADADIARAAKEQLLGYFGKRAVYTQIGENIARDILAGGKS